MGKGIIKQNKGNGLYDVELVLARDRVDLEIKILGEKKNEILKKLYVGPWTPQRQKNDDLILLQVAAIDKRIVFLNEKLPANRTVELYCADYTEDISVDAEVGTIELARREFQILKPGEGEGYSASYGIMVKPGFSQKSAYVAKDDGILSPPVNQTPAQLFYNWAISPGSMKWKPRYRSAIIDSISGDSADITLTDLVYLTADKTEIDIDQPPLKKTSVPIEYMDCNGDAFLEGDEVVVQFTGMDWSSPKIIGFTGEPRECMGTVFYSVVFNKAGGKYVSSGFNPQTSDDIYERLVFKIDPNEQPVWSDFSAAGAECNTDDAFTVTKTREYSCISHIASVYEPHDLVPFDCSGIFSSGNDVQWSGTLDENYMPEDPPEGLGEIDKTFVKNVENLGPIELTGRYGGLFNIGGNKVSIWMSKMACGIISPKSSKAFPNNSVRKLEPVVWPKGYNGRYEVDLILPIFEAVKEVVTFELGMTWFGCCGNPVYPSGAPQQCYLDIIAPNWYSTAVSAGIEVQSASVMYQGEPYYSSEYGCYQCLFNMPGDRNLILDRYWVNGFNIYSGQTSWFGFDILDWPLGQPDPQNQIPTYPDDLRTQYSDLDPFFDLAIDDGVTLQNIEYFKNVMTVPYTHFGYGPTVDWQYSQPMDEVWFDRLGNQITRTKETHIYTLETTWGTAPLTVGGSLWLVEAVTRVVPHLTWIWGLYTIPDGWELNDDDPEVKPFVEYELAGENYSGAIDDIKIGPTDWYYGYQAQTWERINNIFYRKMGTDFRIVVNYSQRLGDDLLNHHFIVIMQPDGTFESANDYDGYSSFNEDNGDIYLYSQDPYVYGAKDWFPKHITSSQILYFLNAKSDELGASSYTKPMVLVKK